MAGLQGALTALQLLAALTLLGAVALLLAGVLPGLLGNESFTVYSGSMEPTIHVGSLAVVQPAPLSALKPGDVVTYRSSARPELAVTHRLVSVSPGPQGLVQLRTRGDAVEIDDVVLVSQTSVLGKVLYSVPLAGYLVDYTHQPLGQVLFLVLPGLLLLLDLTRGKVRSRMLALGLWRRERTAEAHVTELVSLGRRALEAHDLAGADRAANEALAIAPRSEDAWLLKVLSSASPAEQAALLAHALLLNPEGGRLAAHLERLQESGQLLPT
jgi:signal peptidase